MRGFQTRLTDEITFTRPRPDGGEERLTLVLSPHPVGYYPWVRSQFPPPVVYSGGPGRESTTAPDSEKMEEYEDLLTYVLIAKCLQPGTLDTTEPRESVGRAAWEQYARDLRDEFRAAGFTPGEMIKLLQATTRITRSASVVSLEERRGNS